MERSEWLKRIHSISEEMYDRFSPQYWVSFGFYENAAQLAYLKKFLARVPAGCEILSAGCGAGRFDGILLEAGHPVLGIDLSEGMLSRAREHFPQARYEKMALQEMDFHEEFDGIICLDAMEHIGPEDYPDVLRRFGRALKPGGLLYFNADTDYGNDPGELEAAYLQAKERGLPVVYGEVVDELDNAYARVKLLDGSVPGELADKAVYHYFAPLAELRVWIERAGLVIEEEGPGSDWYHFMVRKMG